MLRLAFLALLRLSAADLGAALEEDTCEGEDCSLRLLQIVRHPALFESLYAMEYD